MATNIVNVIISDETLAITQEGFQSILAVDFTADVPLEKISDSTILTGDLKTLADSVLGQTADELWVYGEDILTSARTITEVMDDVVGADFYSLVSTVRTEQELTELSTWVNSNKKLYLAQAVDSLAINDAVSLAETLSSERVALYLHDGTTNDELAGATVGKCAPKEVGSLTWALQTLNGVSKVGYSSGEIATLLAGFVNTYAEILGTSVTYKGNTTSGSKIDITRSKDWLDARITENVTRLLIASDKIPYTDNGISQVTASISEVLEQAIRQGIIEDKYTIDAPLKSQIPANDIANRVLQGIYVTVKLTGAIESVTINVRVTL